MELLNYCNTDSQRALVKTWYENECKSKATAIALGKNENTVRGRLSVIKSLAAKQGYSPEHDMTHIVPDGFGVKGVSTYYDKDGKARGQWVKSVIDRDRQIEIFKTAIEAMSEDIPKAKPVKQSKKEYNKNTLNQYTVTDYHFGMLAWGSETGADWDLEIAEETLVNWFEHAIASSPDSETAIFAQIGDFIHFDGILPVTPTSANILDADTRFQKIIRVVIRVLRRIINMLLIKHKKVHLIMAEGNHDIASSIWLREWLTHLYEGEPRVTVDNAPDIYYCYTFGNVCLFYHHGHKKKVEACDSVFVAKFRKEYGSTEYHYAHYGHLHHDKVLETNLMRNEQHRTLAAPDAHASRGGYVSKRDAKVIVYHKDHGEVGRLTITPEMCG